MEFGRVDVSELNTIDFSLPAEPAFNKKILSGKPVKQSKVYLAVPNGEGLNGSEKFIRQKQRKKISYNIMLNIITALN
jgi:hypothetical protein